MPGPRKLNFVSILLLIVALAGIYSAIRFAPVYMRKWKVKGELSETLNKVYKKRRLYRMYPDQMEPARAEMKQALRRIGISDPGLRVHISVTPNEIVASADYKERIKHPLVNKTTTLHFRPFNSMPTKK